MKYSPLFLPLVLFTPWLISQDFQDPEPTPVNASQGIQKEILDSDGVKGGLRKTEMGPYEGELPFGYQEITSTDHGLAPLEQTIQLSAGHFKPSPGVDTNLLNLAQAQGYAFGFIQLNSERDVHEKTFQRFAEWGITLRASSRGTAWQAEIPAPALQALASDPAVRWVGELPTKLKVQPQLKRFAELHPHDEIIDAWVSMMGDDWVDGAETTATFVTGQNTEGSEEEVNYSTSKLPNGPFQFHLNSLGLETHWYRRNTRTFAVTGRLDTILELTKLNDVYHVAWRPNDEGSHDESIPFIGQDYVRSTFTGNTTEVGIIDTEVAMWTGAEHSDLNIWGVGWDVTGEGLSTNYHGHGTHVSGTILGRGAVDSNLKGNALGVGSGDTQRYFAGRYLDRNNSSNGGNVNDLYDNFSSTYTDGSGNSTARPKVVNNSWGGRPFDTSNNFLGAWDGTEQMCIDVDDTVWDHQQLYVFAAGNDNGRAGITSGTLGRPGVAKNALTVASCVTYESGVGLNDAGVLAGSSSTGPTGDNRMKPEITAPGKWINSPDATNLPSGYTEKSGTSMAAPHVTGMLASLIDAYESDLNFDPKLMRAWVTATAMKVGGGDAPNSNFGFGYANAYRAHNNTADWSRWTWSDASVNGGIGGNDASFTFSTSASTSRLICVLTWDEPGTGLLGGGTAVLADLDLYLDYDDNQSGNNTGNVSSTGYGNYEFIIIDNPPAGDHRMKIYAEDTRLNGLTNVDLPFSICFVREYGNLRPELTLTSEFVDNTVQPGDLATMTSTLSVSDYMATNAMFNITTLPGGFDLEERRVELKDNQEIVHFESDETKQWNGGPGGGNNSWTLASMMLGAIRQGSRTIEHDMHVPSGDGSYTINIKGNIDNGPHSWGDSTYASATIIVDGTQPGAASGITASHAVGSWSSNPSVIYNWTAATDALSGVDGYGLYTSTNPSGTPSPIKDIEEVTTFTESLSDGNWHFFLRTVDNSGNWDDDKATYGPFGIDTIAPGAPSGLTSTSHTAGVWSSDLDLDMEWFAASDSASGIDGYGIYTTTSATSPGATKDIEEITSMTETLTGEGSWYFNLRSVDNAGNWDTDYASFGPVNIDLTAPTGSISINGGAPYTHDYIVGLDLTGSDVGAGVSEMRFSNDGATWSGWEPFTTHRMDWKLIDFGGSSATMTSHVVYAQFRDSVGNESGSYTDGIFWAENVVPEVDHVNAAPGGMRQFTLYAGSAHAGERYFFVGGFSGTALGFDITGIGGTTFHMDINRDLLTDMMISTPNVAPFYNNFGVLDGWGKTAAPKIDFAPGALNRIIGRTMHFAFVTSTSAGPFLTNWVSSSTSHGVTILP